MGWCQRFLLQEARTSHPKPRADRAKHPTRTRHATPARLRRNDASSPRTPPNVCLRGASGPDETVRLRSKDCAARRHLDRGHTPAVEHHEPITMAGAKHAGGFRKGFDDSLDDPVLVTVILKPDIELVATHEADPQHYFCHAHAPQILSRRPNPVANRHFTSAHPSQRNSFETS